MFEFLKSRKALPRQQHDDLVAAIFDLARAHHRAAKEMELPDSCDAITRNGDRAGLVDAADTKVKSLFVVYEKGPADLLYYRCLRHAAALGSLIGVWDLEKRAATIKRDMQDLKRVDRKQFDVLRLLYEESFRVCLLKEEDGVYFVLSSWRPFEPEVIFGP